MTMKIEPVKDFSSFGLTGTVQTLKTYGQYELEGRIMFEVFSSYNSTQNATVTFQQSKDNMTWNNVTSGSLTVVPGGVDTAACDISQPYVRVTGILASAGAGQVNLYTIVPATNRNNMLDTRLL
jgi:hypothetical protein